MRTDVVAFIFLVRGYIYILILVHGYMMTNTGEKSSYKTTWKDSVE